MTNSYGNNLNSAQDKITLVDYNHASRLYVDQNFKFAPKTKFLYHCYFSIDPGVKDIAKTLTEKYGTEIGLLVKQADLPKFSATVETRKKYNRTKNIQTAIQYNPITITFHDDNHGVTTALLESYYRWYYADGWYGDTSSSVGAYNKAGDGDNTYKGRGRNQYRFGLDNNLSVPFFKNIQISQLARTNYTTYTIVNPIITEWQHDSVDNSDGNGMMQNTITLQYEAVHYSRGIIEAGSDGEPTAFGAAHYDYYPSPIAPADPSAPSASNGTNSSAELSNSRPTSNTSTPPDQQLVTSNYQSSGANSNYSAISLTDNGDNLGGLANIIIPKTRGRGGNQSQTVSTPTTITTRSNIGLQTEYALDLQSNPEKLESLAKSLYKGDFLLNGGNGGINGLSTAWDNLSEVQKELYRKQILENAK